jgi:hypothetical protein
LVHIYIACRHRRHTKYSWYWYLMTTYKGVVLLIQA